MPVFDAEFDGLNPTKIYVLSYWCEEELKPKSITDPDEMKEWLLKQKVLIGHNIISFDIPALQRLLGIRIKAKLVDTLYLSWYLYPTRVRHGLEWWGESFGVPKPEVKDWVGLPLHVYVHRCQEDVKINQRLWDTCKDYLSSLYKTKEEAHSLPIVSYLMFKASCAAEQERRRWKLDVEWCQAAYTKMQEQQAPVFEDLKAVMPKVKKMKVKEKPDKPFKKDGTLSVEGAKWFKLLKDNNLPETYSGGVEYVHKEEDPNPNSPDQIKNWLYSLGWVPETFKFVKEEDGSERQIPQVKLPDSPDLCPSVLRLSEDHPEVKALEGMSVLKHRMGLLKGFLENQEDGFLKARVQGLTNTLRFKHTEIVNLPGVGKPWGLEVRGSLVARDGYELVGTDMVSLEDTTKRHYMYFYDPEYVIEMSRPGFDPHLDLAVSSGKISQGDLDLYTANKEAENLSGNLKVVIKEIAGVRKAYKVVNYSAVYGVGPPTLSRTLKAPIKEAKKLLEDYWKRNWSVRKIAEDCEVKTVNGQKWLFNPVSKFWYSLRAEKDRFSTLNQGTGVFCFDSWVRECRKLGVPLTAQFHDETISEVPLGEGEKVKQLQLKAIENLNDKLKLNVKLGVTPQIGHRYSDIH